MQDFRADPRSNRHPQPLQHPPLPSLHQTNVNNRNSLSSTHFVQSSHINYNYHPPPSIYLDSPTNSNSNPSRNSTNSDPDYDSNNSTSPSPSVPVQQQPSSLSSSSSSSGSQDTDDMSSTAEFEYKYNGFESDSSTSSASESGSENTQFEEARSCNNPHCTCTSNNVNAKNNGKEKDGNRFPPELQASIHLALFHLHFVCGICNEVIIDCVCLQCGHNFCTHCLNQWFEYTRTCPTCFYPVPEKFKTQRIYCVDEFLSELYQPVQELCATLFGNSLMPPTKPVGPQLKRTRSEIQTSVGNPRIVNNTSLEERLKLKKFRREHALNHNLQSSETPEDYSMLEQQTELFGGLYSVNLTSVVQFFLSFVTAYIFYEGGDSVDNDYFLLAVVSILVWFVIFMAVMRIIGYEGTFTELILRLNFIEFVALNAVETESQVRAGTGARTGTDAGITGEDDESDSNEDENGNTDSTEDDSGDTEEYESSSSAQSIISMINSLPNSNPIFTQPEGSSNTRIRTIADTEMDEDLFYTAPSSSPNTENIETEVTSDSATDEEDFDDWENMDEFSGSETSSSASNYS